MAKREAVAVVEQPKVKTKTVVKAVEPEAKMITSRELAEQLGTKPTILRRYLRTLPKYQDGGYTRYKWDEKDPFLRDVMNSFEKFKEDEKEKNAKRLQTLKEKKEKATKVVDPKSNGKKSKMAAVEPDEDEEEEPEFADDEEEENEDEELE